MKSLTSSLYTPKVRFNESGGHQTPSLSISLWHQRKRVIQTSAVGPVTTTAWGSFVAAWHSAPHTVLLSIGACAAGVALFIFLLAAIPTVLALRKSAHALAKLLMVMHDELPDTAAAVRLSSLELSDAIEEVSSLGSDLTQGLRASARAIVGAEGGMKQGLDFATQAMSEQVIPSIRKSVPRAKVAIESALMERAELEHTEPALRNVAQATKKTAQRLRGALLGARIASTAAAMQNGGKKVLQEPMYQRES